MSEPSIVATPEEAAALELEPLLVLRPLEALLDAHGIGSGPIEATTVGEGHSNVTYLIHREGAEVVATRRDGVPASPDPPGAPPAGAMRFHVKRGLDEASSASGGHRANGATEPTAGTST